MPSGKGTGGMAQAAAGRIERTGELMAGRRGLVMGVANDRSLAWGIARAAAAQGAEIAFTYQDIEAIARRAMPLCESTGSPIVMPADVADPEAMDALFDRIGRNWPAGISTPAGTISARRSRSAPIPSPTWRAGPSR